MSTGERFTRRKGLVLAVCLLGLVLVANPWRLASGNTPAGILLGLGAACLYAGVVLINKRVAGVDPYLKTIIQLGAAAAV